MQRMPAEGCLHRRAKGRQVQRSLYAEYLDRVRAYHQTPAYEKAMASGRSGSSRSSAKPRTGTGWTVPTPRLWKVNVEALLIATGQNLKRLLRKRGWGRRPWPNGSPEAPLTTPVGAVARMVAFTRLRIARWRSSLTADR